MNPFLAQFISPEPTASGGGSTSGASSATYKPSGGIGGQQFRVRGVTRSSVLNPNVTGDAPVTVLFQVIDFPGDGGIIKNGPNDRYVDGGVGYLACPAEKKKPIPGSAEAIAAAAEAAKMAAEGKQGKKPRQLREIRRDHMDSLAIGSVITVCVDKNKITADMRQKRKLAKDKSNLDVFDTGLIFDIDVLEALYETWKDKKGGQERSAIRYYAKAINYVCQMEMLPGAAQDRLLFSMLEGGQHNPEFVPLLLNPRYDFSAKKLLDAAAPEQSLTAKQIREAGHIALLPESLKMMNAGEFEVPFMPTEYLGYYSHLMGGADGKGKHASKVLFWRTPYCPLSDGAYWSYTKVNENDTHPKFSFAVSVAQMIWNEATNKYEPRTFNVKHCLMGSQLDYLGINDDAKRLSVLPVLASRTPILIRSFVSSDTAVRSLPVEASPEISFGASCKGDTKTNQTVLYDSVVGIVNAGFRVPYSSVERVMKDLATKHKGRYAVDMGTAARDRPSKNSCFVDRDVVSRVFNVLECYENLAERDADCAFFAVMTVGIKSHNSESMQLLQKWNTDPAKKNQVVPLCGKVLEALYFGEAFPGEDAKRAFNTTNANFDFVLFGISKTLLQERGLSDYHGYQCEIDVILPRVLARRETLLASASAVQAAVQENVKAALGVKSDAELHAVMDAFDRAGEEEEMKGATTTTDPATPPQTLASSQVITAVGESPMSDSTTDVIPHPPPTTPQRAISTPDRKTPGAPKRLARQDTLPLDDPVEDEEGAAAAAVLVSTPKAKKSRRRRLDFVSDAGEEHQPQTQLSPAAPPAFDDEFNNGDGSSMAY